MKSMFRGKDGCFIALSDGRSSDLMKALFPYAIPETMVGGISKNGQAYCRFDLRQDLATETFHLRVVFFGRLYHVAIPALNVNGIWVLDGEEIVPFASNQLVHGFGVGSNGKPVGFPRFYKKLGEVPNCVRCPFWVKDDLGQESECALHRWQPAGLHYLNEPQCSVEERQRHGMRLLKVFDRFGNGMTILGEVAMHQIEAVRNTTQPKSAPKDLTTPEERITRQSQRLQLSEYVLAMDSRLADAGCQVPLFNLPEEVLRQLVDGCDTLSEAAAVVNLLDGVPADQTQLNQALADVRDEALDIESLDWALDHDLV